MKILPDSPTSRCGLLHYLTKHNTTRKTIYIPDNAYFYYGRIQNIANCEVNSDWASSESDPSIIFQLYGYRIKPSSISITRRRDYSYPLEGALQGLEFDGWKNICHIYNLTFTYERETKVLECKSHSFYNALRFLEVKIETSFYQYLELDSFDVFGTMLYDFATCPYPKRYEYILMLFHLFYIF